MCEGYYEIYIFSARQYEKNEFAKESTCLVDIVSDVLFISLFLKFLRLC